MSDKDKKDDSLHIDKHLKRSSQDFEPDMDSLLVTAQSALIVDAIKYMVNKDFSSKTIQTYVEAVKGIELIIKILERSSRGYSKIQKTIDMDSDSKKVELFAFELFKKNYSDPPLSDDNKIKAYDILKQKLTSGYYKSLISGSMEDTKKLLLLSGGVDRDKIDKNIQAKSIEFINFTDTMNKRLEIAIQLLKSHDVEIEKGMKGKDISIFIIKASEILHYYYTKIGKKEEAEHLKQVHETYRKYFIVRD